MSKIIIFMIKKDTVTSTKLLYQISDDMNNA